MPWEPAVEISDEDKRKQVADQCRVVAHMARVLASIHEHHGRTVSARPYELTDMIGDQTTALMETLGDILNGMDAVSEEDEWVNSILAEAVRLWPQNRE
jgi:hypothetical protein